MPQASPVEGQSLQQKEKKRRKKEGKKISLKILISAHARVTKWWNAMLVARKASCCVASAFSTRLKLIWSRSSLKSTKMSKNAFFAKSSRSQWVKGHLSAKATFLGPVLVHFCYSPTTTITSWKAKAANTKTCPNCQITSRPPPLDQRLANNVYKYNKHF